MPTNKWEEWIIKGGVMPTIDLPEINPPILDTHVHVYEYMMEEDEDGGVIDADICRICGKSWTELERA